MVSEGDEPLGAQESKTGSGRVEIQSDRVLTLTRRYRAPRELVWEVWTDPKHVAAWWGPFGPEHTSSEIEAAVGGIFHVAMRAPDGSEHPSRGVIRECVPPERLVIEGDANAPDACGAGLPPRALITILFEAVAGDTLLTIRAEFRSAGDRNAADAGGYSASWSETLDALDGYFDRLMSSEGVSA